MDLNEFRSFILDSGIDIWTWIDMAISVASADHENELKNRRDGIIERLYSPSFSRCQNCDLQFSRGADCNYTEELQTGKKVAVNEDDDDDDDEDDEHRKIHEIKILLVDQNQSEKCLIDLLERLVDMDTTFKALKETDIGRHVNKLRKHSSNEVRKLVKILIRKWKDTVDEWVRLNAPIEEVTQNNAKKQKTTQIMDYENIPIPKNAIVTNNGGSVPVKYW
ncbi:hypothetical protein BUALT_Bualt08G0103000 [Buddleja alternifolia]|uniref:TFIIS N-terminal domain-containing protein n=1 Tax=Buddleja alternifolia TaxID=168488 RepID=A0AAV6X6T5_9LAMI|nr:hypothetical protein BUALT_Bualt08G0103000 [Buddleja alternifolia]